MAAQPQKIDLVSTSDHTSVGDVAEGIEFLIERGALARGRPYVGITRLDADRLIAVARPQGARASEVSHYIDTRASLPAFPRSLERIVAVLRDILVSIPAHRSAIFVPSPSLSAFAVANLALPIFYGSGLLRRTPRPIALVPWERELDPATVLPIVHANADSSALLLANRGVVAYSDESFAKLAKFVVSLEESAQLTLNAHLLGGAHALPRDAYQEMQQGIAGD